MTGYLPSGTGTLTGAYQWVASYSGDPNNNSVSSQPGTETVSAALTMRAFSDAFLDDYLARNTEAALASVGCYQLEGEGAQLFERIDGDYFTILGLPLLPLLSFLAIHGIGLEKAA